MTKTTSTSIDTAAAAADPPAKGGTKRKSDDITPPLSDSAVPPAQAFDPLTNLAQQFRGVALILVRHLRAQDTLSLGTANRQWRTFLADEDDLYKYFLRRDFEEGGILIEAVEKHSSGGVRKGGGDTARRAITFKRLYLAWQKRYRLDKTPWNQVLAPLTTILRSSEAKGAADKLIFIGQIGTSSATMEWAYGRPGPILGDEEDHLVGAPGFSSS